MITWNRALTGDYRDPIVGRDVLIGCAASVLYMLLAHLEALFGILLLMPNLDVMRSTSHFVSNLFGQVGIITVIFVVGSLVLVFLLRLLLRRDWLAIIAAGFLAVLANPASHQHPWTVGPLALLGYTLIFFVLVRFGLVAVLSGALVLIVLNSGAMTTMAFQTSAWYSGYAWTSLLIVAILTIYGFHTSLGGRRLLDLSAIDK